MTTLAEELPKEQERVRGLIRIYQEIGPPGTFAIIMMEQALRKADHAVMSGDVVAMMRSYEDLKGFKE